MKPNGKYFVVRVFVFALVAVAVLSAVGNAETVSGKFKLPTETRWGMVVLAPGDYEFTFQSDSTGRIVTVKSEESGWSGMIMATAMSDAIVKRGSSLELAKSERGTYVKTMYLGDLGVALDFNVSKPGKAFSLTKSKPATTVASASGTH